MTQWTLLSNHGRVILCIARDPEVRLRDIAAEVGVTERSAFAMVSDLADDGYIVKEREGRRNRYEIQPDLPLPEAPDRAEVIGAVLKVLSGAKVRSRARSGSRLTSSNGSQC
jgi:Winged helix-turn-helix DNA-binding